MRLRSDGFLLCPRHLKSPVSDRQTCSFHFQIPYIHWLLTLMYHFDCQLVKMARNMAYIILPSLFSSVDHPRCSTLHMILQTISESTWEQASKLGCNRSSSGWSYPRYYLCEVWNLSLLSVQKEPHHTLSTPGLRQGLPTDL